MQSQAVIIISIISLLLIISGIIKLVSRYVKIPFPILLILVGFVLSRFINAEHNTFQALADYRGYPDILLFVCLPTLIFEAAFTMDGRLLRQNLLPVLALSIPGLCISTLLIGLLVSFLTPLNLMTGFLLGAILSATDSVAVVSIFRQLNVPKRLAILIEGESLFNSSTGFVVVKTILFIMLTTAFTTHDLMIDSLYEFCWNFFGGILVGFVTTWLIRYLISKMEDDITVIISLTVILAYFSFILAEIVFGVSGVMATITAGVMMADWGKTKFTAINEKYISQILKFLTYIVNSLIFILVGFSVNLSILVSSFSILVVVIMAMLIARAVMVFGLIPLLGKLPNSIPINFRYQTITWLSGIQGAIGLTIVLGISDKVPNHDLLISLVMGAVLFTIIIQGSIMGKMIHWLRLDRPLLSDKLATLEAELSAEHITLDRIPSLQVGGNFSMNIANNLKAVCQKTIRTKTEKLRRLKDKKLTFKKEKKLLFLSCLAEEKYVYYDMFTKGHLSEPSYRILNHNLDMEIDSTRFGNKLIKIRRISFFKKIYLFCIELLQSTPILMSILNRYKIYQSIVDYEEKWGAHQGCVAVLAHLDIISQSDPMKKDVIDHVKNIFLNWYSVTEKYLNDVADQFPEFVHDMQTRFAKRVLLYSKYESMIREMKEGQLPKEIAERVTNKYIHQIHRLSKEHPEKLKLDPYHLLRQATYFKGIPDTDLKEVIQILKEYHPEHGEVIVREGDVGDSLYLIARGVIRVIQEKNGQDVEVATLMAGDFFGEIALIEHVKRTATCKAVTPCILYILTRADFDKLCERFPVFKKIVVSARLKK